MGSIVSQEGKYLNMVSSVSGYGQFISWEGVTLPLKVSLEVSSISKEGTLFMWRVALTLRRMVL